ncbi:GNAT family N-acetyltransferase [Nocardioides sp. KC13]|uniref:GNAT family N-acetyltransferase n=1 Tax=Nocardioides turkmenicus TaxID=2711220 RepID=A0A6M1R6H5_9ACTN|nr:GNAT family N-acetyltransferase [Nocardioides sp. KC13]NGN95750.1 GNAT family N-acetyltransferase [Nocardioides sp. KC13]
MSFSIRGGSIGDVGRCVDLWTRVIVARDGSEVADEAARKAQAAFTEPTVRFAVVGSAPDGFALTLTRENGVALLSRLCVDPAVTSRGMGAALVADAVEHARDAGFQRIELEVRETNARAIALYERAGFTAVSEPWAYDEGDRVVTWSLDLAKPASGYGG